jgi:hypothetical protein
VMTALGGTGAAENAPRSTISSEICSRSRICFILRSHKYDDRPSSFPFTPYQLNGNVSSYQELCIPNYHEYFVSSNDSKVPEVSFLVEASSLTDH